jgi:sulfonate transport system ATP-binding protein
VLDVGLARPRDRSDTRFVALRDEILGELGQL